MWLRYPLEQHCTAAAADQAAHPVTQDAMLLEGDAPLAVLPSHSKIFTAAVAALADGQLLCVHVYPSLSVTHHTTETENSHSKCAELSKIYHLAVLEDGITF